MKLRIGLLGVGHLGKIHAKCIQMVEQYEFVGFYDPSDQDAAKAIEAYGIKRFEDLDEMLDAVDVVDIVTPTVTHYKLAKRALQKGKHVFIEKPVTHTLAEAEELMALSQEMKVKVQVGHVERFNPAFLALDGFEPNPRFIEAHRLATFNPRGTDVSVVLDLMIHDLDIVLSLVQSPVKSVHANGVAIISPTPDITNARIEFENGCVANLTASRISLKQMRKLRFFQPDAYISLDFLEKNAQIVRLFDPEDPTLPEGNTFMELDSPTGKKLIHIDMPEISPVNSIKMELETFAEAIINNERPKVSIDDGYRALALAHQISESAQANQSV